MPIVYAPRFCPVCKKELWNERDVKIRAYEDGQREGLAWNQELARWGHGRFGREIYVEHVTRIHPEFASWEDRRRIFQFLASMMIVIPIVVTASFQLSWALAKLAVGFVVFLNVIVNLRLIRGRKRARELWDREHPLSATL